MQDGVHPREIEGKADEVGEGFQNRGAESVELGSGNGRHEAVENGGITKVGSEGDVCVELRRV